MQRIDFSETPVEDYVPDAKDLQLRTFVGTVVVRRPRGRQWPRQPAAAVLPTVQAQQGGGPNQGRPVRW